jgi:hypothetical protein
VSRLYRFVVVPLGWMVIPAADPLEKSLRPPSPLTIVVAVLNGEPSPYVPIATPVYGGEKLGSLGLVELAWKFQ